MNREIFKLKIRLAALMFAGVILLLGFPRMIRAEYMTAHFISVGSGDAIFIELPDGSTMLVDGGKPEMGRRVSNYIEDMGYDSIDIVVLTHSHADHIGGLIRVLKTFEIGELWLCPYEEKSQLTDDFAKIKSNKNIAWSYLASTQRYDLGSVKVEVFNPPLGSNLRKLRGPNGASVVMKLRFENTSLMLAGDVDSDTDQELVEAFGGKLSSTVLKCAHHGSAYSSSGVFLNAVSPDIAVVSTGPSEWEYPSVETMERIEEYCEQVYRTDEAGDVIIEFDGKSARVISP